MMYAKSVGTLLWKVFKILCKISTFCQLPCICPVLSLTSIAGLVHVNDLNLTTHILVFPCQTCSVYAMKQFGHNANIFRHLWIFL